MSQRAHESYGQRGVSWVDRLGVWLSQRAIRRRLPRAERLVVLELGCGYRAAHLLALENRLQRGVGLDFAIAPEIRQIPKFEFYEGAIEENLARLEIGVFDAVLLISVLEHLDEPLAVLKTTHALLKPGGLLLVNVPTWRGKVFLEFSAFRLGLSPQTEMDDHKMYYNKRDLWPLLVRSGFRPSAIKLSYHKFGLNLFATATRSKGVSAPNAAPRR
ncbi:MAG TPA: methyltransferase domain-containing protein [Chthoniobacterales bacterium]|nr:methyltransferase domain-containing protein [Chthoniobacterales bacterium]